MREQRRTWVRTPATPGGRNGTHRSSRRRRASACTRQTERGPAMSRVARTRFRHVSRHRVGVVAGRSVVRIRVAAGGSSGAARRTFAARIRSPANAGVNWRRSAPHDRTACDPASRDVGDRLRCDDDHGAGSYGRIDRRRYEGRRRRLCDRRCVRARPLFEGRGLRWPAARLRDVPGRVLLQRKADRRSVPLRNRTGMRSRECVLPVGHVRANDESFAVWLLTRVSGVHHPRFGAVATRGAPSRLVAVESTTLGATSPRETSLNHARA
jgi:hypothetical protein